MPVPALERPYDPREEGRVTRNTPPKRQLVRRHTTDHFITTGRKLRHVAPGDSRTSADLELRTPVTLTNGGH